MHGVRSGGRNLGFSRRPLGSATVLRHQDAAMDRVVPSSPVAPAVRAVVRRILDQALTAGLRLAKETDSEALHDVRVALRRLRVILKAYARELKPGITGNLRKALRSLADRTGPGRDAEVFALWLEERIPRLRVAQRKAASWLLRKCVQSRDTSYRALRTSLPKGLSEIAPLLRAGLAHPPERGKQKHPDPNFGALTSRRVDEHLEELLGALAKVKDVDDDKAAHRARIAAKKLRYILEPALLPKEGRILKGLKGLQDAFGEFHDLGAVRPRVEAVLGKGCGPRG